MNRDDELRTLLQANRIIHGAEAALMEQIADLDKQRMGGHDTALAERGLQAFANCLSTMRERRELIVRAIQQIDRGLI